MSELLGDVEGLPEEEPVFQSSGVAFEVKTDDGHPMIRMIGIFVFVICGLGIANGLDFISPDSGLVRPHEWINGMAKGAPYDSAEFTGTVFSDGEPVVGAEIVIEVKIEDGLKKNEITQTDEDGKFSFSEVSPGLTQIKITRLNSDDKHDEVLHRIILNPPSPLESKGYTNINFELPDSSEFDQEECEAYSNDSCIRQIDYREQEMEFPLIDESAAGLYVTIGWGMIGLALIASGFAFYGIKNSSRGLIQTSCVLVFFTAGHFYSACVFSLMAFALTFTIPRKSQILEA
tara:strand:- start:58 stop:924 length:867 start_codon:yes stop_codon:yes gene_type:complete